MFGINKTVIDSLSKPHSKLHKCHNALSFHHVPEAIASKYVSFTFLDGKYNPTDIEQALGLPTGLDNAKANLVLRSRYSPAV